jgi:asparagine synthase (glutamine-hydrolysing)
MPGTRPVEIARIACLSDALRRRGPDGSAIWSSKEKDVVFGHRRLAIIDLSASGAQPMSDVSGRWVITFNGEIYNYRVLRSQLEQKGYIFRTNSDTEVLINVVAHWGEAGLRMLRGMFAFALWDALERELWLVRDPYGIKPIYVAQTDKTIWFSSHARPLAAVTGDNHGRDAAALTGFYLWGHVPEPFTWWDGIRMLPAGHVQRIKFGKRPGAPRPFHRIQDLYVARSPQAISPDELRSHLLDTIRHHLVADVPVGIFLSAGIDSTVIAALAAELGTKLNTVTLAFDEYINTPADEAPIAENTARMLGAQHVTVRVSHEEFDGLLNDFIKNMDQPSIDGLNTYLVSHAAAKQGLKVALSGLGGDELFGGYPSFKQIPRLLKFGQFMQGSNHIERSILRALCKLMPSILPPKLIGLRKYSNNIANAYMLRRALFLNEELDDQLDQSWLKMGLEKLSSESSLTQILAPLQDASSYAQIAALESCWYMRNQLLRDTDWSSMAHGLEVRVPYVDIFLLEALAPAIASGAPPRKKTLAESARALPKKFLNRPKTGFTTPVDQWICHGTGSTTRGLRGWASTVHRYFRVNSQSGKDVETRRSKEIAKPLRILAVLSDSYGEMGGIAKFNRDFLRALDADASVGRVSMLARIFHEPIGEQLPETLVCDRVAGRGKWAFVRRILAHALTAPTADYVICGHVNLLPGAWLVAHIHRAKLVLVIHGIEAWNPGRYWPANKIASNIDALISVSRYSAEKFQRWSRVPADKTYILPNCVDLDQFTPGERDPALIERYGLHAHRVMLTMGRLASQERYKGVDEILDILPALLERYPNLKYLIVGDGSDRRRLLAKVEAMGLSANVIFTGTILESEKVAHYNIADIYVMPSTGEGFGIVLIEAAACGVPVVGSALDGSREALLDGKLGRLVDPKNQQEIIASIADVLDQPKPHRRSAALETFSTEKYDRRVSRWIEMQTDARRHANAMVLEV